MSAGPENRSVRHDPGVRSVFSDSTYTFVARAVSNVAFFLFITLAIKALGDARYGTYSIFMMLVQFLYLGLTSWLNMLLVRYGREEYLAEGDMRRTLAANLALALPIIAAVLAAIHWQRAVIRGFLGLSNLYLALVAAYYVLNYLTELYYFALQALGRFRLMALGQSIEKAVPLAVLAGFVLLRGECRVGAVILAVVAGYGVALAVMAARTGARFWLPLALDGAWFRRYFRNSVPLFFGVLLAYIMSWFDIGVIRHALSLALVGQYYYCVQVFNGLNQFTLILVTVVGPLAVTLVVKNRQDLIDVLLSDLCLALVVAFQVVSCAVWLAMHYVFVHLAGAADGAVLTLTLGLLLVTVPYNIYNGILSNFVLACEMNWVYTANTVLSLGIKMAVSYALILRYGLVGGALGTIASLVTVTAVYGIVLKRRLRFSNARLFLLLGFLAVTPVGYALLPHAPLVFLVQVILLAVYARLAGVFHHRRLQILQEMNLPVPLLKALAALRCLG